ncbi:hypothetical protein BDR07DRAFT_1436940, partial [Suillus spraguei]
MPFLRYLKAASAGPHAVSAVLESRFCRSLNRFCGTYKLLLQVLMPFLRVLEKLLLQVL